MVWLQGWMQILFQQPQASATGPREGTVELAGKLSKWTRKVFG